MANKMRADTRSTETIHVRLTLEELGRLDALRGHKSRSDYIRQKVLK